MPDEQTNTLDTDGTQTNPAVAPDGEALSDYDKALALVERREKATEEENKVLDRKEKLAANSMLGGTTGGNVPITPPKEESPKEYRERVEKEMREGKKEW